MSGAGMAEKAGVIAIALGAALALSGCSDPNAAPELMHIRSSGSPDEFAILPVKPLAMPDSLNDLPAPTPGGSNRTDQTPEADAIIALGGNPNTQAGGIPSADAALAAQTGRYGTEPGIRSALASEDLTYRQNNKGRPLERLFKRNVYYSAYGPQALDQHNELEYWRSRGIRTPSAPPERQ